MNVTDKTKCICGQTGYAPDCPQSFMQGGKWMHTLDNETQLKPRVYGPAASGQEPMASAPASTPPDESTDQVGDLIRALATGPDIGTTPPPSRGNTSTPSDVMTYRTDGGDVEIATMSGGTSYYTDKDVQFNYRGSLQRFQPLQLNGKTLTAASIGGYVLDLNRAAEKAAEYAPLPPAMLPIIFHDRELNFSHHFFCGLEVLVGRKFLDNIVKSGKYSASDEIKLLPAIKGLVTAGMKENDSELTVFVKRILSCTFDTLPSAAVNQFSDALIVGSNFYGFQYIEQSMACKDTELKMWLHLEYLQYQMRWFNAFKSAGVPKFALSGVQDRYESDKNPAIHEATESPRLVGTEMVLHRRTTEPAYRESTRRKHEKKSTRGSVTGFKW